MHLLEGVIAILAAIGLYGWAYGYHHHPASPGWARGQLFASAVSLLLAGIAPVGVGLVALGLGEPVTALSWLGFALLAVTPLALWAVLRG